MIVTIAKLFETRVTTTEAATTTFNEEQEMITSTEWKQNTSGKKLHK